jgi:hypothetical protein
MLEGITILAFYGSFGGGQIGDFLNSFQQAGFFTYVLPFLILFSIVFAILTQTKIFKDAKGINAVIALAVALMALQFNVVSDFFSEVFPRVGVGLAILFIVLIFVGMFFSPKNNAMMWTILGVGVLIAAVIFIQSAGSLGWSSAYWWYDNWEFIVGVIGFIIVLAIVVGSSSDSKSDFGETALGRAMLGK